MSLLLANGTPMLLAGDEFGNTQYGNNNAYCQDNVKTANCKSKKRANIASLLRAVNLLINKQKTFD